MSDIISKYPYTDLHSVNLDYILKIVRENAGLHLEISGNQLLLKTADNTIVSAITIPYATEAGSANSANSASYASTAGSAASATYAATAGSATTATNATNAAHAVAADTATTATAAASATNADHATAADTATYATSAGTATTADYATSTGSVDHAQKAFEAVQNSGNQLLFTKGDNTTAQVTVGYAQKSGRDANNNIIANTYFASVIDDSGILKFRDAQGNVIGSVQPSLTQAQTDNYGNMIADYIKSIAVSSNSNYVTIDHGTGTAETIVIHYSDIAWKDTNGNVIKNTYIKDLEIVADDDTGHYNLVAYNGDDPQAELFRIEVKAYEAQIAAEATHAASADYATNAGTAQTALTSTGSVSSIASPNDEKQKIVIQNGDGTTTTFNIFNKGNPEITLVGAAGQDMPFDSGFIVGHTEEYSAEGFENYGWTSADIAVQENMTFTVVDDNRNASFTARGYYTVGSGICVNVFDSTNTVMKVFRILDGNSDDTLIVERVL